jgi:predicted peroxiredoxin
MKVLVKSAWGSDDPTKSAFAFLHANALAEAGHDAQIFLLGEAVSLMRDPVANAIVPVATAGGDPARNGGPWHTNPCLRCLFKGSWSP